MNYPIADLLALFMSYYKSGEAAQRHDMHLALSIVLRLLHTSVAVLADVKRLFCAGFEEAVFISHIEWDASFGGPITQKAPHRILPYRELGQRGNSRLSIVKGGVRYAS
jgi:hypothetical protein